MRKLIYAINITADGCCDHTKFRPDEDTFEYYTQLMRDADTLVYGRKTYELMVPYWPDIANDPAEQGGPDHEFAQAFDTVENIVVFSRSLNSPEGEKTSVFNTGLKDEILKLKQQPGKNILTGGMALPSQLAQLGLIDEYRIVVHPIVAGQGRRLFEELNLQENLKLNLIASTVFKSGAVLLRYGLNLS